MSKSTHNTPRREIDAATADIGTAQTGIVYIPLEDDPSLQSPDIQIVDGPRAMEYAEEMAFMEEKVIVNVHTTPDQNAENPVSVFVNGRSQYLFRGVPTIVKRKFVERLARAKLTGYRQELGEAEPSRYNRLYMETGLLYPFSVVRDDNPKGADWLHKVLREA